MKRNEQEKQKENKWKQGEKGKSQEEENKKKGKEGINVGVIIQNSDVGNLNVYPWNFKYSPRRQFSTHLGQLHTLRQILSLQFWEPNSVQSV